MPLIVAVIVSAYGIEYVVKDEREAKIVEESYEPYMTKTVKLKRGAVFIDVGAHVGKYSFYASRQVGDKGKVIAIEPFPQNIENLKKGIKLNNFKNITIIPVANGEHDGIGYMSCEWFGKEYSAGSAHLVEESDDTIEVPVKTIDNIIKELGLERVDMMKIDVERNEWNVIKGAKWTIEKFMPILQIEIDSMNEKAIFAYLLSLGYEYEVLKEVSKKLKWKDVLFTPRQNENFK